ncbi:hypothetical protein EVAR_45892_1 [Eumeta japonica]|uniref:Uncharacterized protein n=1 Tax=Eumeta variegata TaxID=151549 RepID=A0A4C1XQ46_EUMVA|nr:hypothetical protein EVAR_45892_1 [Eumeta japonica]
MDHSGGDNDGFGWWKKIDITRAAMRLEAWFEVEVLLRTQGYVARLQKLTLAIRVVHDRKRSSFLSQSVTS